MSDNTTRPLGEWLQQRREQLNISLEKAETETRIRAPYLRALEGEDLAALPNPVVARGFLRNYAAYLGLDAREAVSRYTALAAPGSLPPPADLPAPAPVDMFRPVPLHNVPGQRRPRRGLTFGLILAPILLALLLAWGWWNYPWVTGMLSRLKAPRPTATHEAAGVVTALPAITPSPAATLTRQSLPATAQPTAVVAISPSPTRTPRPSPTSTSQVYTGVFVELFFLQKSWVQVTVDGTREFQGEMDVASRRSWYGNERVELRIGNAGGVQVTVNGQNLGTLGAVGEVVDRVFETAGAATTRTPAITPTVELPTHTPLPPSATPVLTPTIPPTP